MKQVRKRLTYSNVTSTLCLFLLLGGGAAFAATKLAKNSVGTKQLKNGAVTAAKVKRGSLSASNFAPGQLPAGKTGPQGPQGLPGKEGPQGPGATQITFTLPASTSPTFSKVGSFAGISLEAECKENAGTHAVILETNYTSASSLHFMQTESKSLNNEPTKTEVSSFTDGAASVPTYWENVEAEEGKTSIERFDGNIVSPKLITSESYVVNGGPSGNCEAAIGSIPAS
ncbi:MAG: hypothetical protein WB507_10700 [Solirubrobacterales bacterium]